MLRAVERYQFTRTICFLGFVHCFWHSEDKKGIKSKSVENKRCLCQTDFSYNSGKGLVLSNSMCLLFQCQNYKKSTDKLAAIRDVFESIISRFQLAYRPNEHTTIDEE
jgi:hypothetical protein